MKRVNAIQIETVWSYKTFELHQGDSTSIPTLKSLTKVSEQLG
jgi:hypothetical protein